MPKNTLDRILEIARAEIGVKEIVGNEDNPRILEYKKSTPLVADSSEEVAWCASFVNWVLEQAGLKGTGNPMARSFMKWGFAIKEPIPGCVVVLKRGAPPSGHVGFFVHRRSPGGWVQVLGGNQSDQVKVSFYQESDVLGYRTA
jgi:uncharacterized protein (TIGR02594 family)